MNGDPGVVASFKLGHESWAGSGLHWLRAVLGAARASDQVAGLTGWALPGQLC